MPGPATIPTPWGDQPNPFADKPTAEPTTTQKPPIPDVVNQLAAANQGLMG